VATAEVSGNAFYQVVGTRVSIAGLPAGNTHNVKPPGPFSEVLATQEYQSDSDHIAAWLRRYPPITVMLSDLLMTSRALMLCFAALTMHSAQYSYAEWRIEVEAGALWTDHNDVQIPNDSQGDRFDIADLGRGPYPTARFAVAWRPWTRHEFQLVLAPLAYEEKGSFEQDVRFAGETYRGGEDLKASYQFNSYRLRYLYTLIDSQHWGLELGGTLFVRDARIELSQNGTSSADSNIGLVPLLALKTDYRFNPRWRIVLDSDMAAAPQGRAIDLALSVRRQFNSGWEFGAGYRTVEGGADNDSVYTFAWFNAAILQANYRW
jgi:hypothetical protein